MATTTARRVRLDQLLVERGLVPSRARAQALVMAGQVRVGAGDGARRDLKSGDLVARDVAVELAEGRQWVSRGAHKLLAALDAFGVDPAGRVAVDVGASTGGFTDVLLAHGAARVYAVDVGHGQLAWKLRSDARVVVLERTNARHLTAEQIPEKVDMVVCDASFIGLETVLPAALALARPGAVLAALIKPQFEVGKGRVGKGGVVREPELHAEVCERIHAWLDGLPGWRVEGITESPILGPRATRNSSSSDGSRARHVLPLRTEIRFRRADAAVPPERTATPAVSHGTAPHQFRPGDRRRRSRADALGTGGGVAIVAADQCKGRNPGGQADFPAAAGRRKGAGAGHRMVGMAPAGQDPHRTCGR
jgi:23S rRNA (cytidine1920-2'-O)/16S rRNA (cytidine1409-2'-O)-methyltransferase